MLSQPPARAATVSPDGQPDIAPFVARGIRIYGIAERPIERVSMVSAGIYSRITPTVSWNWNLSGEPAGDTWYESHKTVHTR
ncbi:hypothetical protein QM716_04645 [Rhodococcus sp. IEGM 1409]|uniref:hypothetical protein n=1 Tax=Rhodococcus sp. IEGM 1409 TaxID=3047082 RepID=UPI0024B72692|nr:hypothetical protein [Rhodococcus sp. IEGM 1409]MDI9899134.1 hypothetical protein [Rhodococcus sp. IEGM 1409]